MIDNFEKVLSHLSFKGNDEYVKFEAIVRSKDKANLLSTHKSSTCLKCWTIGPSTDMEKLTPVMKEFCDLTKARLYASLNVKSAKKTLSTMMNRLCKYSENALNGNAISAKTLKKLFQSCSSSDEASVHDRRVLLDVDTKDIDEVLKHIAEQYIDYIIPTKSGYHVIVKNSRRSFIQETKLSLLGHPVTFKENALVLVYMPDIEESFIGKIVRKIGIIK